LNFLALDFLQSKFIAWDEKGTNAIPLVLVQHEGINGMAMVGNE